MCGLSACFAYHPAAPPVDRDAVARITAAMRNRGPDGEGSWHSDDGRAALGHTRLAVIAPGEEGAQPMRSADGRLVVSFNGEIYNHRELRADLRAQGHRLRTESDTEILLALYAQHGEDMLARLRGMFAFALWDGVRGELLLARDPYGIKPLYYADDGWTLRAASQVKALLRDPGVDGAPCPAGRAGFYVFGSVPEPFTTCRGVRALPAGCLLRVGPRGPGIPRRWFSLPGALASGARRPAPPAAALLREALLDSVRAHLVADVPIGLFLSAGLDSGTLLALCREAGARPQAVTVVFDAHEGAAQDESALAAECAARYDVPHHVERVSREDFEASRSEVLAAMDQPSIDGVNTWFVARAASRLGLKVALSGLGGDELLGGYPSFRQLPWFAPLSAGLARIPLLGTVSRKLAGPLVAGAGLHPKAAGVLATGGGWAGGYLLRRGLFMPWELAALMGRDAAREALEQLEPLGLLQALISPDPGSARGRVTALESGAYLRNQLLRDADWAGMAHGLEIRTPLVDAQVLCALAPVIARRASREGKQLLEEVPARRLPEAIRVRARTGFQVPFAAWLGAPRRQSPSRVPPHVAAMRDWALAVAGPA